MILYMEGSFIGVNMIQQECVRNFQTLSRAFEEEDISVVLCKDTKGKEFQTICIVYDNPDNPNETCYMPFGFMGSPSLYGLLNKISPPETLKGDWMWNPTKPGEFPQ